MSLCTAIVPPLLQPDGSNWNRPGAFAVQKAAMQQTQALSSLCAWAEAERLRLLFGLCLGKHRLKHHHLLRVPEGKDYLVEVDAGQRLAEPECHLVWVEAKDTGAPSTQDESVDPFGPGQLHNPPSAPPHRLIQSAPILALQTVHVACRCRDHIAEEGLVQKLAVIVPENWHPGTVDHAVRIQAGLAVAVHPRVPRECGVQAGCTCQFLLLRRCSGAPTATGTLRRREVQDADLGQRPAFWLLAVLK
mmetsp:Transcript_80382/g.247866  ORF Transcript_80382/g.247866 Transcript_80382/m.247866 type:complete len:247 (-) Transcript_80382:369-1109(-)